MGTYETQIYEKDGPVVRITFNRPERRNATNIDFHRDLSGCLDEAEADPEVRAIVLTGTGPVFSAGQDLKWSAYATAADFVAYRSFLGPNLQRLKRGPKITIARVNGDALGGGCFIATACDLVVARKTARLAFREIQSGETSGAALLHTVGRARCLELNLLGRYVTGEEAVRWNMINQAVDTDEELDQQVNDWVEQLTNLPPLGLRATKDLINFRLDAAGDSLRPPRIPNLQDTQDRLEAKRAWNEKRKPVFVGR